MVVWLTGLVRMVWTKHVTSFYPSKTEGEVVVNEYHYFNPIKLSIGCIQVNMRIVAS